MVFSEGTFNLYYITAARLAGYLSGHLFGAGRVCLCVCEAIPLLMAFVFPTEIQAFKFPLGSPELSIKIMRFKKGPSHRSRGPFFQSDPNNTNTDILTSVLKTGQVVIRDVRPRYVRTCMPKKSPAIGVCMLTYLCVCSVSVFV